MEVYCRPTYYNPSIGHLLWETTNGIFLIQVGFLCSRHSIWVLPNLVRKLGIEPRFIANVKINRRTSMDKFTGYFFAIVLPLNYFPLVWEKVRFSYAFPHCCNSFVFRTPLHSSPYCNKELNANTRNRTLTAFLQDRLAICCDTITPYWQSVVYFCFTSESYNH